MKTVASVWNVPIFIFVLVNVCIPTVVSMAHDTNATLPSILTKVTSMRTFIAPKTRSHAGDNNLQRANETSTHGTPGHNAISSSSFVKPDKTISYTPTPTAYIYRYITVTRALGYPPRPTSHSSTSTAKATTRTFGYVQNNTIDPRAFQEPRGLVAAKGLVSTVLDVTDICSRILNIFLTLYNIRVTVKALAKRE
ncbi:hypothetical protein ACLMJK_003710 [Lecanora helva]